MVPLWLVCGLYGLMTENLLSKETDRPCYVSEDPSSVYGRVSVLLSVLLPLLLGPLLATLLYLGLRLTCSLGSRPGPDLPVMEDVGCLSLMVSRPRYCFSYRLMSEIVVHLVCYIPSMVWSESYLSLPRDIFMFVLLKCVGSTGLHWMTDSCVQIRGRELSSGPRPTGHSPHGEESWDNLEMFVTNLSRRLCHSVKTLYRRGGSTQTRKLEMTYEEVQRHLGLGVMPHDL